MACGARAQAPDPQAQGQHQDRLSVWPNIIPPHISLWDAAAPPSSQVFMLPGALLIIPAEAEEYQAQRQDKGTSMACGARAQAPDPQAQGPAAHLPVGCRRAALQPGIYAAGGAADHPGDPDVYPRNIRPSVRIKGRAWLAGRALRRQIHKLRVSTRIIPPHISLWDAAAPPSSQVFMLPGALLIIPVILMARDYLVHSRAAGAYLAQ
jgi:hypothetical protein